MLDMIDVSDKHTRVYKDLLINEIKITSMGENMITDIFILFLLCSYCYLNIINSQI